MSAGDEADLEEYGLAVDRRKPAPSAEYCAECAAKPGCPTLCARCLAVRERVGAARIVGALPRATAGRVLSWDQLQELASMQESSGLSQQSINSLGAGISWSTSPAPLDMPDIEVRVQVQIPKAPLASMTGSPPAETAPPVAPAGRGLTWEQIAELASMK